MPDQVVSAYSGVRQLYDDGARSAQNLTREYVLDFEGGRGERVAFGARNTRVTDDGHTHPVPVESVKSGFPGCEISPLPIGSARNSTPCLHPQIT